MCLGHTCQKNQCNDSHASHGKPQVAPQLFANDLVSLPRSVDLKAVQSKTNRT